MPPCPPAHNPATYPRVLVPPCPQPHHVPQGFGRQRAMKLVAADNKARQQRQVEQLIGNGADQQVGLQVDVGDRGQVTSHEDLDQALQKRAADAARTRRQHVVLATEKKVAPLGCGI